MHFKMAMLGCLLLVTCYLTCVYINIYEKIDKTSTKKSQSNGRIFPYFSVVWHSGVNYLYIPCCALRRDGVVRLLHEIRVLVLLKCPVFDVLCKHMT